MAEGLQARAREAAVQMLTAAMVGVLDGDTGPLAEVTGELDRMPDDDKLPFLMAMLRPMAEVVGRYIVIAAANGQDPRALWQAVALEMAS
jgi:hypothetical protein